LLAEIGDGGARGRRAQARVARPERRGTARPRAAADRERHERDAEEHQQRHADRDERQQDPQRAQHRHAHHSRSYPETRQPVSVSTTVITRVRASVGTCTRSERGATETAFAAPVTLVAGMFPGSTPDSTPRYSSVVVLRRPSSHFAAVVPSGGRTHARAHRDATCSAAAGAAETGSVVGSSSGTGGSNTGSGGATGVAALDVGLAPTGRPTDPFVIPMPIVAATSTASTPIAVRARR